MRSCEFPLPLDTEWQIFLVQILLLKPFQLGSLSLMFRFRSGYLLIVVAFLVFVFLLLCEKRKIFFQIYRDAFNFAPLTRLLGEGLLIFGHQLKQGRLAAQDVSHTQLINDNFRNYFIFDIKHIFKSSIEASIGLDDDINYHSPRQAHDSRQYSL